MQKLTITTYKNQGGQYVKQEKEIEAEFITRKEAVRRRLHIVHARAQHDGTDSALIVYQGDDGAYFYTDLKVNP